MSIEPTTSPESQRRNTTTTKIAARGRSDPWATADEHTDALTAARAPRQFEPLSFTRMQNLMDGENAYCDANDHSS